MTPRFLAIALLFAPIALQADDRIRDLTFDSPALEQAVKVTIVTPDTPPPPNGYPVLFILHGHGRNNRTLIDDPATRDLLLAQPFVTVLPNGKAGWWIDSPLDPASRYESLLTELVDWIAKNEPVSQQRSDWAIAGWSMGGYGAMRYATRHPERFSFVGTIIGLLDFPKVEGLPPNQRYDVSKRIFGEDPSAWDALNPIHDVSALANTEVEIVIAERAFDLTMNRNFIAAASAAGIKVQSHNLPGGHTFSSVTEGLKIVLPAVAQHFTK